MNIVAVVNRKGGVAKTTTAVNLAAAIALTGRRTLLVDLDPQGSVAASLAIDPVDDGSAALFRKGRAAPVFARPELLFRLGVLPADESLEDLDAIRPARLAAGLAKLRDHWAVVVIDTPPGLGHVAAAALGAADAVVIPVVAEFLPVDVLRSTLANVRAAEKVRGQAFSPLVIVPTMTEARRRGSAAAVALLRERFGGLVSKAEVPRSARFDTASLTGLPVVAAAPASPAAQAYATVAGEVLGALRERPAALPKRPQVKEFVRADMRAALLGLRAAPTAPPPQAPPPAPAPAPARGRSAPRPSSRDRRPPAG